MKKHNEYRVKSVSICFYEQNFVALHNIEILIRMSALQSSQL